MRCDSNTGETTRARRGGSGMAGGGGMAGQDKEKDTEKEQVQEKEQGHDQGQEQGAGSMDVDYSEPLEAVESQLGDIGSESSGRGCCQG